MQKHKYRILGVLVAMVLVITISIIIFPKGYAFDFDIFDDPETTTEELTCADLEYKYGLYIEDDDNREDNKYIIRRDGGASANCDTEAATQDQNNATLKVARINDVDVEGPLLDNNSTATITADLKSCISAESGQNARCITVDLVKVKASDSEADEWTRIVYEENDESSDRASLMYPNPDYNTGVCAQIVSYANSIGPEGYDFVKKSIGYCFEPQVVAGLDYSDEDLQKKFDNIKAYWDVFSTPTSIDTGTFATKFSDIKAKATGAGNVGIVGTNDKVNLGYVGDKPENPIKCSYKIKEEYKTGSPTINKYGETIDLITPIVDPSNDDDYYREHDYYYATSTTESGTIKYTYNYAIGNTVTEEQTNVCKRTCEEAVKVEYGMPVASKAGLCFEYRVKVTSYVTCSTTSTATPPTNSTGNYCNPAPKCTSQSGVLRKKPQAGPTEEFDSCISKCDGGKYTEKCSLKCYEEVYGKTTKTKLNVNYEDMKATKLAISASEIAKCLKDNDGHYGCYSCEKLSASSSRCSKINWYADVNYDELGNSLPTAYHDEKGLGRWYLDRVYKTGTPNYNYAAGGYDITGLYQSTGDSIGTKFVANAKGFYQYNNNGTLCTDLCIWKTDTCSANEYLNPGAIAEDYKANMQEYEASVAACTAQATCTSKTAEFNISVDYNTKTGTVKETFPTTTNKDVISSKGTGSPNTNTATGANTAILDYAGCYKAGTEKNWYMTEWGFPGTYIHNKTGEISYQKPSDLSGYYYENKKFCTPLNALSVNAKWVEYAELDECWRNYTPSGTDITYNINAQAKNFGYFGWDFNISCFYGLKNEVCQIDEATQCCDDPPGPPTTTEDTILNYRTRSVDLKNLFPGSDAATNPREIGFNWTNGAEITEVKNKRYAVNPEELALRIQNDADSLYGNDSELDYYFELTPENLNSIRKYNDKYGYDKFNGDIKFVDKTINAYSMQKFLDKITVKKYDINADIGCNNGTC